MKLAILHHALDDFLTAVDQDSMILKMKNRSVYDVMILKNRRVYDVFTCALKLSKNIDAYYRRDVN